MNFDRTGAAIFVFTENYRRRQIESAKNVHNITDRSNRPVTHDLL